MAHPPIRTDGKKREYDEWEGQDQDDVHGLHTDPNGWCTSQLSNVLRGILNHEPYAHNELGESPLRSSILWCRVIIYVPVEEI